MGTLRDATRRACAGGAAGAALLLAGCVTVDRFADRGLTFNEQIVATQNSTLFLNIVRAAYKHPMAFTSLANVAGTASASGQLGFALPFADNPNLTPFQVAPQISASGGPTFTINNLDSQEFMKGFLTPVDTKTIDLFGQEGLPWQELYNLFIAKVAITDSDGHPLAWLFNTPGNWPGQVQQEAEFQAFLEVLRRAQLRTEEIDGFTPIGPELTGEAAPSTETAIKVSQASLTIKTVSPGHYQLGKPGTEHRFCVANPEAKILSFVVKGAAYDIPVTPGMRCGASAKDRKADAASGDAGDSAHRLLSGGQGGYQFAVTLRSAESVTYYLGEILRQELCLETPGPCVQHASPILVRSDAGEDPGAPLFEAERRPGARRDLTAVRYMGQTFSLPGGQGDRSAQVLTILGQLVNLNKSAKDNPSPNIVTLVGH